MRTDWSEPNMAIISWSRYVKTAQNDLFFFSRIPRGYKFIQNTPLWFVEDEHFWVAQSGAGTHLTAVTLARCRRQHLLLRLWWSNVSSRSLAWNILQIKFLKCWILLCQEPLVRIEYVSVSGCRDWGPQPPWPGHQEGSRWLCLGPSVYGIR